MVCGNMKAQTGNWSSNAAATIPGNGTAASPYLISTTAQLARMALWVRYNNATYADKYYALGADIDLEAHYWDIPIGTSSTTPFRGKFDGKDFKISQLYCTGSISTGGLFGFTIGAEIKNLDIENITMYGFLTAGCLIGTAETTLVENCTAAKGCSVIADCGGGLIGYATGTTVKKSSFSGGSLSNVPSTYAGGLIGRGSGLNLSECSSEATILGATTGGLIGCIVSGTNIIKDCYSTCIVESTERVGGFIGDCSGSVNVTITGCRSSGSVVGQSWGNGGFIGYFNGTGRISDCISDVSVKGLSSYTAGFIGRCTGSSSGLVITACRVTGSTEAIISSAPCVGGFIGEASGKLSITHCSAEGQVISVGSNNVGGFCGWVESGATVSVSFCSAFGNVKGGEYVGGFAGSINSGTFTDCYAIGAVEGDWVVGGFFGSADVSCSGCYAVGVVKGNMYVGGFSGFMRGTFTDCYAAGTVFGETYAGGFVGLNNSGGYTKCYFDRQTTGLDNAYGSYSGSVPNIEALTTTQLTNMKQGDFSTDKWIFTTGYYPQLKSLANASNFAAKVRSGLSVVPLKLTNDTETVANVQTEVLHLADKTPNGNIITWSAGTVKIGTVSWRLLTLSANDAKRSVIFHPKNIPTDGNYLGVIVNKNIFYNTIPEQFSYTIACGSRDESAIAEIVLSGYENCEPATTLTLYANTPQTVTATAANGQTKTYTFVAEKPLPSDIFVQRWKDVLAINNNFTTNGGYNFTGYEWYRNGTEITDAKGKGYIQEKGGLSRTAEYTVVLTTQQRDLLKTCPAVITNMTTKSAIYPNPAQRGQSVRVETGVIANALMQLFDTNGNLVAKQTIHDPVAEIIAPNMPGTYILQITENGVSQTFKIAVE